MGAQGVRVWAVACLLGVFYGSGCRQVCCTTQALEQVEREVYHYPHLCWAWESLLGGHTFPESPVFLPSVHDPYGISKGSGEVLHLGPCLWRALSPSWSGRCTPTRPGLQPHKH
jgi:hypothetical protein